MVTFHVRIGKKSEKEYGKTSLRLLEQVKKAVNKLADNDKMPCVCVSSVVNELRKDPRTVEFYLSLLEIAEFGRFSRDRKVFMVMRW